MGHPRNPYAWLDIEMAAMRRSRFLFVDAAAPSQSDVDAYGLRLPREYREFVVRYGDAEFFRTHGLLYRLSICWPPPRTYVHHKDTLVIVGMTEGRYVAFRCDPATGSCSDDVLELSLNGSCRSTGLTFSPWFKRKFDIYRRKYGSRAWTALQRGPHPFTPAELDIVAARREFVWQVAEMGTPSQPTFQITNRSWRRLSFITIRFVANVPALFIPKLVSGVFIPVDDLPPGGTKSVCRSLVHHGRCDYEPDVRFFDPPHFDPEEREYLWEFRPLQEEDEPRTAST